MFKYRPSGAIVSVIFRLRAVCVNLGELRQLEKRSSILNSRLEFGLHFYANDVTCGVCANGSAVVLFEKISKRWRLFTSGMEKGEGICICACLMI